MQILRRIYQPINILSIDVASGAVICALFFCKLFGVTPRLAGVTCLFFSVWLIYTMDHLLDARAVHAGASSARHRFHQKYFKWLLAIVVLVASLNFGLLFFMRTEVVRGGFLLALAVAFYLGFNKLVPGLKEFVVAFIYTAGVVLLSTTVATRQILITDWILMICFFLVALINLVLFSLIDRDTDQKDGFGSFVLCYGQRPATVLIIASLFVTVALLSSYFVLTGDATSTVLVFAMVCILFTVYRFQRVLRTHDIYRWVGDAIFFIPIAYLIF